MSSSVRSVWIRGSSSGAPGGYMHMYMCMCLHMYMGMHMLMW